MTKRPATGLAAFAKAVRPAPVLEIEDAPPPSALPPRGGRRKRGSGEVVALTVKLSRADWQRLRQLADAEGTSIQALAEEGFSAVFARFGLPAIDAS